MIARISPFIVLAVVLPDVYIYLSLVRKHWGKRWQLLMWWTPSLVLVAYTCILSLSREFAPANMVWLYIYFALIAIVALPKFVLSMALVAGCALSRGRGIGMRTLHCLAAATTLACYALLAYGFFVGPRQLAWRTIDLAFSDLPPSFDGYTMALFSDVHAGSVDKDLLQRMATGINSRKPDIVLFAGDLKNIRPQELDRVANTLKSLHARDGVYSIMGNHDYGAYISGTASEKAAMGQEMVSRELSYGWRPLLNDRMVLRRGRDSIVVAGEEDYGSATQQCHADLARTLRGVSQGTFVVFLQHNPNAWRKHILPNSRVQLTLSGHTHGGQVALFGLHASSITTAEDCGIYRHGNRVLYVTSGIGGLVPFRVGVKPEVVYITLHRK